MNTYKTSMIKDKKRGQDKSYPVTLSRRMSCSLCLAISPWDV